MLVTQVRSHGAPPGACLRVTARSLGHPQTMAAMRELNGASVQHKEIEHRNFRRRGFGPRMGIRVSAIMSFDGFDWITGARLRAASAASATQPCWGGLASCGSESRHNEAASALHGLGNAATAPNRPGAFAGGNAVTRSSALRASQGAKVALYSAGPLSGTATLLTRDITLSRRHFRAAMRRW